MEGIKLEHRAPILEQARLEFLRRRFREYYEKSPAKIHAPPDIEKREFGFSLFAEKIMVRHKSFSSVDELLVAIRSLLPSDVYYSTAYYSKPWEDMERKGWLGADLCFDIDADHIPTPCKSLHDMWVCNSCGSIEGGEPPKNCPKCGASELEEKPWFCDQCLDAAKREAIKLIGFLTEDFGMDESCMGLSFSGHRGFHLHVKSDEVLRLDDEARKEIVDYIMGLGLQPDRHGIYKEPRGVIRGPQRDEPGWRGRLAQGFYELILELDEEGLVELGFPRRSAQYVAKNRSRMAEEWSRQIRWGQFEDKFGISAATWKRIVDRAVQRQALSVRIDTVVTADIHRLIRLPETLNGKTGFRSMMVNIAEIERFDPLSDPLIFTGEERILVVRSPVFRVGTDTYGPYNNEKVTLPAAAAVLLVCKGLAFPVIGGV